MEMVRVSPARRVRVVLLIRVSPTGRDIRQVLYFGQGKIKIQHCGEGQDQAWVRIWVRVRTRVSPAARFMVVLLIKVNPTARDILQGLPLGRVMFGVRPVGRVRVSPARTVRLVLLIRVSPTGRDIRQGSNKKAGIIGGGSSLYTFDDSRNRYRNRPI